MGAGRALAMDQPPPRSDTTFSPTGSATIRPPLPVPAPAAGSRPSWWTWPRVYFLLAAFDVLTVSATLYLNHRITQIYFRSVQDSQEWARRASTYAALGELAAAVNAPGNDVFDSHDVAGEAVRMQQARRAFQDRLAELRADIPANMVAADGAALRARLSDVERAMEAMVAEAGHIFSNLAGERRLAAGERMATMDRAYARVLRALRELSATVAAIQRREFERQTQAAAALQRYEYVIVALILVMVAAALAYGRRMGGKTRLDAEERAAYIRDLQAADESLRAAHAHLEKRVQERTRALRESEAALRLSAEEWQRTFEAIHAPVMVLDGAGRALRLNRAALALAGRPPEELSGVTLDTLGEGQPWRGAAEAAERVREQPAASLQVRDPASGRTWDITANRVAAPADGRPERVIVVARDITRLIELQESLGREERMAAMGALVAGVAHEVRNPLFAISSTLDAFEARFGGQEASSKYFAVLRRESSRLATLMRDLLDYGKPPRLEMADCDFSAVVKEAVQLSASLAESARVGIEVRGADRPRPCVMDHARMQQVLHNIVQNAIQHSPAGGVVRIEVSEATGPAGAELVCSVRDQGPGFEAQDLGRVFEPFWSRRSGGTGIGLSIAQGIVARHGGTLQAANAAEGGAVMTMRLPLAAEARA